MSLLIPTVIGYTYKYPDSMGQSTPIRIPQRLDAQVANLRDNVALRYSIEYVMLFVGIGLILCLCLCICSSISGGALYWRGDGGVLSKFEKVVDAAISGNNIKCDTGMTPESCAQRCLDTENCTSFDFKNATGTCCTSSKNRATAGSAFGGGGGQWDYYERK